VGHRRRGVIVELGAWVDGQSRPRSSCNGARSSSRLSRCRARTRRGHPFTSTRISKASRRHLFAGVVGGRFAPCGASGSAPCQAQRIRKSAETPTAPLFPLVPSPPTARCSSTRHSSLDSPPRMAWERHVALARTERERPLERKTALPPAPVATMRSGGAAERLGRASSDRTAGPRGTDRAG
jgi:hypothetical protein